ncbi:hypothetical protein [Microtetraspora sp. NBRC 16547]|uniref:hypothetical protein n=1 Tax=Microtetraspora sp. NBRC 16547 TaxID=3030993 RepID=UPI0024A48143|nr:hypothetical protein [Microtetraspora sp. NBRC 16547]GLW96068.1 hypothetical protein Misp02_01550 [Microtetraspora sp. NBRC 16547]
MSLVSGVQLLRPEEQVFCVSSDFRTRTLRHTLDATIAAALAAAGKKGGTS